MTVMTVAFRTRVLIDEAMQFEACLPQPLRLYSQGRKEHLLRAGVTSYLYADGELAGECYGAPTSTSSDPDVGMFRADNDVCMFGCAILEPFRGRGLAKLLVAHWLGCTAAKGALLVVGHAVHPAMKATLRFYEAEFSAGQDNWGGSGLTAHFFKLRVG